MIAHTPEPPYYAVIFSSTRTEVDDAGYRRMAMHMDALAKKQKGYLGIESVRTQMGITVSYWKDLESIRAWKQHTEHMIAQKKGKAIWYSQYKLRIARVESDYGFEL